MVDNKKLNNLNLNELIFLAKNINYIQPSKEYNEWSENDILFDSIYIGLNHKSQIDTLINLCNMFSPIKLFAKEKLRTYINNFLKK